MTRRWTVQALLCAAFGVAAWPAVAAEASVAVAANFTDAAKEIAAAFTAATHDEVRLSFGASGQFVTQITQGAPFQVFLSADAERPQRLEEAGLAVPGTALTYAVGRLVLWSRSPGVVRGAETLTSGRFDKLSICNAAAAPYGEAAVEAMTSLGVYTRLVPKLVVGADITQAFQFVQSGNAELGFVAYSQVVHDTAGSSWMVPQDLYKPIRQDAVLLKTGQDSPTAKAFLAFLKGPAARAIIERYGYGTEPGS